MIITYFSTESAFSNEPVLLVVLQSFDICLALCVYKACIQIGYRYLFSENNAAVCF